MSQKQLMLPVVLGLCDGIFTTLLLAAGRLTEIGHPVTVMFAIRIALVAFLSNALVFYVARYSELRGQLIHAERQLNMSSFGKLATGALGRAVRKQATLAAAASSGAGFSGALIPLLVAALLPQYRWISIVAALVALAVLGAALARVVHGAALRWIAGLLAGGIALTVFGTLMRVAG